MKIYIITTKGRTSYNSDFLRAWADTKRIEPNGTEIVSVKAFTKLKYAKDWTKLNSAE